MLSFRAIKAEDVDRSSPENYSYAHAIKVLLNDSFKYYMLTCALGMVGATTVLAYGTIRYHRILDLSSYLVYPFCALRCSLDFTTLFSMAGQTSSQSNHAIRKWRRELAGIRNPHDLNYNKTYLPSCRRIACSAGPFFTFEGTVLLVSFDHCINQLVNLLVTLEPV